MDPTEAELNTITDMNGVLAWDGVDGQLTVALWAALGQPQRVREIALIPRLFWDGAVEAAPRETSLWRRRAWNQ